MADVLDLDAPATQEAFAELVGVSQPAIAKQLSVKVLSANATYRVWLLEYCARLRLEASGRGGDGQVSLTRARTKEALANANIKELQFYRELKLLIPADEIEPVLTNWAAMARSEVQYGVEKLIAGIQSQHGIEVDAKLIDDAFNPAFRVVAAYPAQLDPDAQALSDGMDSADATADAAVAD